MSEQDTPARSVFPVKKTLLPRRSAVTSRIMPFQAGSRWSMCVLAPDVVSYSITRQPDWSRILVSVMLELPAFVPSRERRNVSPHSRAPSAAAYATVRAADEMRVSTYPLTSTRPSRMTTLPAAASPGGVSDRTVHKTVPTCGSSARKNQSPSVGGRAGMATRRVGREMIGSRHVVDPGPGDIERPGGEEVHGRLKHGRQQDGRDAQDAGSARASAPGGPRPRSLHGRSSPSAAASLYILGLGPLPGVGGGIVELGREEAAPSYGTPHLLGHEPRQSST